MNINSHTHAHTHTHTHTPKSRVSTAQPSQKRLYEALLRLYEGTVKSLLRLTEIARFHWPAISEAAAS